MKMYAKFEKYWRLVRINPLLLVAVVLDPRFKLGYYSFSLKKIYENDKAKSQVIIDKVKFPLARLYTWYNEKNSSSNVPSLSHSESASIVSSEVEDDIASEWKRHNQSGNYGSISEVDKYLNSPIEDEVEGRTFEILAWWKSSAMKYPILSQVARDVLAIPVTSVASESSFSTGGRVLDSFRSCLRPNIVEALVCMQNWLHSGTKAIDLEAEMKEVEE